MRARHAAALVASLSASQQSIAQPDAPPRLPTHWCGTTSPSAFARAIHDAAALGLVADPALAPTVPVRPRVDLPEWRPRGAPCLAPEQIYLYEDSASLLVSNYSDGELFAFMVEAANQLIADWGDNYDFIGFWMNFTPTNQLGSAAFYLPVENTVRGIGFPDGDRPGVETFNNRPDLGLVGDEVEGLVMMWNIHDSFWEFPNAARAVMGHELLHRWASFLPPLEDGTSLQGDNKTCYSEYHWDTRVDAQASVLGISEWIGTNPAVFSPMFFNFINFNTEIPNPATGGGLWSYPELYLMGYVTPEEMDSSMQEFRYMVDGTCEILAEHFGQILHLSSADIIEAAGPRVPASAASQKEYRAAWIMIHQPDSPPSPADLERATMFLEQNMNDWGPSTLGRGSIDHALFFDPDCDGVPDAMGCNAADLAEPFGALDFSDALAFLTAFAAMSPAADLAEPAGVFDFSDALVFLTAFADGCP